MSGIDMSDGRSSTTRADGEALREEGTLASVEIGQTVTISVVGGEGALRQHFLDMGVIPGAQITLEKYAPMGDPMEFSVHGYQLTLRIADARKIRVTTEACPVPAGAARGRHRSIGHPGLGEDGLPDKVDVRTSDHSHPVSEGEVLRFALAGNQNCGKTTLFNQLTGSNQHVGNFPASRWTARAAPSRGTPTRT